MVTRIFGELLEISVSGTTNRKISALDFLQEQLVPASPPSAFWRLRTDADVTRLKMVSGPSQIKSVESQCWMYWRQASSVSRY